MTFKPELAVTAAPRVVTDTPVVPVLGTYIVPVFGGVPPVPKPAVASDGSAVTLVPTFMLAGVVRKILRLLTAGFPVIALVPIRTAAGPARVVSIAYAPIIRERGGITNAPPSTLVAHGAPGLLFKN